MLERKCVLTILELNWNQRLGHKKAKLNICHHMLTSSTQLQNRSFHVEERTRTSSKCQKVKKCTCKACKNTVFHCQICKFVGFLLPSWLLKLPIIDASDGAFEARAKFVFSSTESLFRMFFKINAITFLLRFRAVFK